jgi:hypothetical protein
MKKKIRLCHSVWTKPMKGFRWNVADQLKQNLWLFALSVAYAKKMGAQIVLHTDQCGKEIYGFLPYDEIYLTLDTLDVHERFWAAGKIYAQEAEPLGSIHIDGDVFLKKRKVYDIISDTKADLIVQMTEGDNTPSCLGHTYGDNLNCLLSALGKNLPVEFNKFQNTAYNCGLVKFNNPELKKRYINGYKQMVRDASNAPSFVKQLTVDNDICPDLIIEQWWLKSVTDFYNYRVKSVLPEWGADIQKEANRIGYTHVIGKYKYELISTVKERLLEVAPELYKQVEKVIAQMTQRQ